MDRQIPQGLQVFSKVTNILGFVAELDSVTTVIKAKNETEIPQLGMDSVKSVFLVIFNGMKHSLGFFL